MISPINVIKEIQQFPLQIIWIRNKSNHILRYREYSNAHGVGDKAPNPDACAS